MATKTVHGAVEESGTPSSPGRDNWFWSRSRWLLLLAVAVAALIVTGTVEATGVLAGKQGVRPSAQSSPSHAVPATSSATPRSAAATSPGSSAPVPPAGGTGAAGTVVTVVRPVTSAGAPAPGYTVTTQTDVAACNPTEPFASPVAVDNGIVECFPSALYLVACWRTQGGADVFCLRNALKHELVRLPTQNGVAQVPRAARRLPLQVRLSNRAWCSLRAGGTGDFLADHHDWTESYYCDGNSALWFSVPAGFDSTFDTTGTQWTAQYAPTDGRTPATTVPVTEAYFVGTARA